MKLVECLPLRYLGCYNFETYIHQSIPTSKHTNRNGCWMYKAVLFHKCMDFFLVAMGTRSLSVNWFFFSVKHLLSSGVWMMLVVWWNAPEWCTVEIVFKIFVNTQKNSRRLLHEKVKRPQWIFRSCSCSMEAMMSSKSGLLNIVSDCCFSNGTFVYYVCCHQLSAQPVCAVRPFVLKLYCISLIHTKFCGGTSKNKQGKRVNCRERLTPPPPGMREGNG